MHILGSQFMEKLETVGYSGVGYSGVSRWYTKVSPECSCNENYHTVPIKT